MNSSTNSAPEHAARNALLQRIAADREAGIERTLEEYQREFPGHGELVANELGALAGPDPRRWSGHYEIVEEIGRGAQGVVNIARETIGSVAAWRSRSCAAPGRPTRAPWRASTVRRARPFDAPTREVLYRRILSGDCARPA